MVMDGYEIDIFFAGRKKYPKRPTELEINTSEPLSFIYLSQKHKAN